MVEVLSVFNVVVLQHAMVALSHKLPGTHQLSVYLHKEEQPVSLKGPDVRASQLHVIDVLLTDYMARVDYPVPQLSQLVLRVLAFVVRRNPRVDRYPHDAARCQSRSTRPQARSDGSDVDRRALDVPRGADKPHRALIEAKMLTDYGRAQPHWPLARLGKYVSQTFKHHVDFVARR
jgi:hypothetical protein